MLDKIHDLATQNKMFSSLLNKECIGSCVLPLKMCAGASRGECNNLFRTSVSHFLFTVTAWMMFLHVVTDACLQELQNFLTVYFVSNTYYKRIY